MILERLFIASGEESLSEAGGKEISVLTATAESVFLPALCLGCSVWLRHRDPFFLASQFPWIWVAPLLVALRHGSLGGILASLTLFSGWSLAGLITPMMPMEFPRGFFLGGFITTFLGGEFRDLWQAENRRQRKARHHLAMHLDDLAAAHQILAQSHDQLSLDFISHPPTLRDALAEIPRSQSGRLDLQSAQALLAFLSRFFQIETAALHLMENGGLKSVPLATLGSGRNLDGTEALIGACLRSRSLCHVEKHPSAKGPYLFAAPLASGKGPLLAILAVESMPFFAFHEENLRHLAAILGYYADTLFIAAQAAPVLARLPHCPADFAAEYLRLHRLQAEAGMNSVLACRVFAASKTGNEESAEWDLTAGETLSPRAIGARDMDSIWMRLLPDGRRACMALLPFVSEAQGRKALARFSLAAGQEWVASLASSDPVQGLVDFLADIESPGELPLPKPEI